MGVIRFSQTPLRNGRVHWITAHEVGVVLHRLPPELWARLRAVHFNDRAFGARWLGYVNRGRREIAICALPPRVSLSRFCRGRASPAEFGARRGAQWPEIAIRRFMLYNVFLHELGHLQVINPMAKSVRRKFAAEMRAQAFADKWRRRLWLDRRAEGDPVHDAPPKQSGVA